MEKYDLAAVPVTKRAEVRRRIAVLDEFVALEKPTNAQRQAARAELGVSRQMFYVLQRAWRERRDPTTLPGARLPKQTHIGQSVMAPAVETVIASALAEMEPNARGNDFIRAVAARCEASGQPRPSKQYLLGRLRDERAYAPLMLGDTPLLLVDFCAINAKSFLPDREAPIIVAGFLVPERRIIAHNVIYEPPSPAAAATVLSRSVASGAPLRTIALPKLTGSAVSGLKFALNDRGIQVDARQSGFAPSKRFRPLAGETLGGLRLRPGQTNLAVPFTPSDEIRSRIEVLVEEAVAQHNLRFPALASTAEPTDRSRRLANLLEWAAQCRRSLSRTMISVSEQVVGG